MFAAFQNHLKIEEATSSKDEITPVYLLDEIWQLVQSLPADAVAKLVDHTKKRLSNRSPVVKQKTLRLIKTICSKGSSEYKRSFQRQAAAVRELTHYKGEPDAFKGDVPNQRSRIQGFGGGSSPTSISSTSSTAATGTSRITGFGNPKFEGSSTGNAAGSVTSPKGLLASISSKAGFAATTRQAPFMRDQAEFNGSDDERPSAYQPRPLKVGAASSSSAPQLSAGDDGKEEARLVDSICVHGGVRAQPAREDLRVFVESVGSLDGPTIAELLQAKLEDPSWQVVLRALFAVEAVVQQGSTAACGQVAVHFQANLDHVRKAAASPQASVRQRAAAVLKLLGGDDMAGSSTAPRSAQRAPVADLMGGIDEQPGPAADLLGDLMDPVPAQPANRQAAGSGMFDGLAVGTSAPGQSSAQNGFAGGPLAPQPSAAQQSGATGAADMFGGLSLGGSPAPAASSGGSKGFSGDLFGGLSTANQDPHDSGKSAAANGDPFAGLQVAHGNGNAAHTVLAPAPQKTGRGVLDADLFGGVSQTSASIPAPAQALARGPVSDIFGSNGSPSMIALASPEKAAPPDLPQGFSAPAMYPQHAGMLAYGYGATPAQMQQYGMYAQQQLQQAQYMQLQMQQYQMQQMQMGMGGYLPQQQQPAFSGFPNGSAGMQQSNPFPAASGTSHAAKSDLTAIRKDPTFDFVGDHMSRLRLEK